MAHILIIMSVHVINKDYLLVFNTSQVYLTQLLLCVYMVIKLEL